MAEVIRPGKFFFVPRTLLRAGREGKPAGVTSHQPSSVSVPAVEIFREVFTRQLNKPSPARSWLPFCCAFGLRLFHAPGVRLE